MTIINHEQNISEQAILGQAKRKPLSELLNS